MLRFRPRFLSRPLPALATALMLSGLALASARAAQPDEDGLTPISAPGDAFPDPSRSGVARSGPARTGLDLGGGFIEFLFTGRTHDVPLRPVGPGQPARRVGRVPAVDPRFDRQSVAYDGPERAGTVVVDTATRFLYLVQSDGQALRYGVGVGREGFEWHGRKTIERKAEWPKWRPPAEMLKRRPELPTFMAGGTANPLGARAMYLAGTLYRIHGSNEPWSIGQAVSSGCIRMRNEDVIDLYQRVKIGTPVVVL